VVIAMFNTSFYYTRWGQGNTLPLPVKIKMLFIPILPDDALSDTVPFRRKAIPGYLATV
jgi:hypothetical protein